MARTRASSSPRASPIEKIPVASPRRSRRSSRRSSPRSSPLLAIRAATGDPYYQDYWKVRTYDGVKVRAQDLLDLVERYGGHKAVTLKRYWSKIYRKLTKQTDRRKQQRPSCMKEWHKNLKKSLNEDVDERCADFKHLKSRRGNTFVNTYECSCGDCR